MSRAFALLLLCLALVGGGYYWGHTASGNQHAAAQLKTEREEFNQFKREVGRGQQASLDLQTAHATLASNYDQLQEVFDVYKKRAPILARPPAAPVATAATPGQCPEPPAAPEPGLSAGAVWMWNSALAGAGRPVGACGLADPSEAACAPDTGLSLQDAWANHTLNARLCAEDRQRHQHLIDYIRQGPAHAD